MSKPDKNAFTLLEILLAICLLIMLAGVVVFNADAILSGLGNERPLPEIMRKAVREARFLAAQNKEATYLFFDVETGDFVIKDPKDTTLETLKTGLTKKDNGVEVTFYQLLPGAGLKLPTIWNVERREATCVCFFPDRSSTPFEVYLNDGDTTGTHRFDPFSEAEFVKEDRF